MATTTVGAGPLIANSCHFLPGKTVAPAGDRSSAVFRPDMSAQPVGQWRGCVQDAHDPALRLRGAEPRPGRPIPPGDQALVAEQFGPRVILGVTLWAGLEHVVRGDVEAGLPRLRHDRGQLRPGAVRGDGAAEVI